MKQSHPEKLATLVSPLKGPRNTRGGPSCFSNEHWLGDPHNVKKLWRGFLVVLALTVIAGFFVDLHPHFEFEKWPGFSALYGFVTCLLMIVGAKALGIFLKRRDSYYAKELNGEARDE